MQLLLAQLEQKGEAAMDGFIGFAEVVGAVIAAMGLAMGLEWLTLSGVMHLMPVRHQDAPKGHS